MAGKKNEKVSKIIAGYIPGSGRGSRRCGDCSFFIEAECQKVAGKINEDDVCAYFKPIESMGDMPADLATKEEQTKTYEGKSMLKQDVIPSGIVKSLFITKVTRNSTTGEMRFFAKASGVDLDAYGERMSKPLFNDFIKRAESREAPPPQFTSDAWNGGLPYLGVAHYLDLGGDGIAGDVESIWVDGDIFKAKGRFRDNKLGRAVYKSVSEDIANNVPDDERVRISIAFLDYGHSHDGTGEWVMRNLGDKCPYCMEGIGNKIYKSGHLIHLAATRVPAYADTSLEIELEERSMKTKKQDAESIIGEDLAEELDQKSTSFVNRSESGLSLVVRMDEGEDEEDEEMDKKKKKGDKEEDEEEMSSKSLGGAVTIEDAELFLSRNNLDVVDSPAVLITVLSNIAGQKNIPFIQKAVQDYARRVDVLALESMQDIAGILRNVEVVQRSGESASAHPLDAAYHEFIQRVVEAEQTPVQPQIKLQMLQEPLNAFANEIQRHVGQAPAQPASGASQQDDEMLAKMRTVVSEVINPLADRVNALEAGVMAGQAVQRKNITNIVQPMPQPRQLQPDPTLTNRTLDNRQNVNPNSIDNLSRRSVGLNALPNKQ